MIVVLYINTQNYKIRMKEVNSSTSMRIHWFEHVRKTRKQLVSSRKAPVTHQEAMREASISWPTKKEKLQKKLQRQKKKLEKANKK